MTWREPPPDPDLPEVLGDPINLTGFIARMQIRPSIDSTTVLLELTTENGGITLGGAAGTIDLLADADATALLDFSPSTPAALAAGAGVYDLELEAADGEVTRLLQGNVVLDPEVTR